MLNQRTGLDIPRVAGTMDGNVPPSQPDRNSITISVRFKCNICDFQCLRLPEAEQHSMKQHCTIQPFLCNTCTVSCKTYHDALNHLTTPLSGHWRPPKMEERDLERWAQFQFVLTSYTVLLTVTCRDDIVFLCCLCTNSTSDTEAAVKHLVSHNIWKRDNVKGHCDICTFYYLSGIDSIKQLRDFSGALNGCTHNIASCLLSNLKISLQPFLGKCGLKSHTINWSSLFSTNKPNLSGNAVPFVADIQTRPEQQVATAQQSSKFNSLMWPNASFMQANSTPLLQQQTATSWYNPGTNFSANPTFPCPTMLSNQGPPFIRPPRPEFLPPPANPVRPNRLTFEQHMARERMIWLMDERYKRQMADDNPGGMSRARVKRRSAVQISPGALVISKETLADRNSSSDQKRARTNSQPITVIDLTDIEGDEDDTNDVVTTGVDNVSSTTSNGDNDTVAKKATSSTNDDNNAESNVNDDNVNYASEEKPTKNENEVELHSTVSSNLTETTHIFYGEIFLEDDNGFLGDVPSEEENVMNQQILDLSVKKDNNSPAINTDVIPLDLSN